MALEKLAEVTTQRVREIPFGKPMIGEEEVAAALQVLSGTQLVHGPRAKQFETEFANYCGGGYATSVSSCTAGLHLAYFDLGVGPGDEIIVPAQTHAATAHAVEFTGAKPVFVDADPRTGNVDLDAVADAVTERTRAISVVHYLGLPVDMRTLTATAQKHGLAVVEDCALALGSFFEGTHCGLLGDLGCFSFYPVKHMTTAEGGMVISRHEDLIRRFERKKAFGVDRTVGERIVPGVYDVKILGFNYRMNELAAAIGIEQLRKIRTFLDARAANTAVLRRYLAEIDEVGLLWAGDERFVSSHYCTVALLDDSTAKRRFDIVTRLKAAGVGTSVYYPAAVPHLSYYKQKYGYADGMFPRASRISRNGIAFPVGPHLGADDMHYMAEALKNAIKETRQ
jgi:perosamine synthetase